MVDLTIQSEYIQQVVHNSGLAPLLDCSYRMVDKGLLSAFTERWHRETSSFHLPVGEMTITLDDVSSLCHLSVSGAFFSLPLLPRHDACLLLISLLGVSLSEAMLETDSTRGAHVRLSWLMDIYNRELANEERLQYAARAFLLHLVGCTLFADKSSTYIEVAYLELFRELDNVSRYAWGAAALAFLYEHLGQASLHHTKQMAGYMTILQVPMFKF